MKVSHLLIPALLLSASAAMAQSSVTMYGLVDLGVGKLDGGKVQMQGSGLMNNTDSHIGLRGVEDLGGGLKAGFTFESAPIQAKTGMGGGGWTREASVWVGGDWGTLKMGRLLTASYLGYLAWEITGNANYGVVANTYGIVGAGINANSEFLYSTPNFSGLQANLGYILKADGDKGARIDTSLTYASGPFAAALSYNKNQDSKANWAVGGKYSFGNFALATSYNESRTLASSSRRSGVSLGGAATFGAASLTLDVTRDTKHELGALQLKKYTNAVLEAKYKLSKRTSIYGAALRLDSTTNYGLGVMHTF